MCPVLSPPSPASTQRSVCSAFTFAASTQIQSAIAMAPGSCPYPLSVKMCPPEVVQLAANLMCTPWRTHPCYRGHTPPPPWPRSKSLSILRPSRFWQCPTLIDTDIPSTLLRRTQTRSHTRSRYVPRPSWAHTHILSTRPALPHLLLNHSAARGLHGTASTISRSPSTSLSFCSTGMLPNPLALA